MEKMIIGLTQEQIDTMVHESCVLFCKHCGCGIPRDTCTSLGTCKEHDEYRTAIRTHLMEKKKEYPKSYEECIGKLPINWDGKVEGYKCDLLTTFQKLLICRDAYWKIAGEEMGLGKPWEPENPTKHYIFTIETCGDDIIKNAITSKWINRIFVFPTEEMRDAFKKNFDPDIEICKELL